MRSIDIHAHITPQCFWKATEGGREWHSLRRERDSRGREFALVGGRRQQLPPKARWTPEERLADMDSLGVDMHVLSPYSGFYNYHLGTEVALATSKDSNDEIGRMIKAWPDRFAGLASLPMQGVAMAIAELERVMIHLGFGEGVVDAEKSRVQVHAGGNNWRVAGMKRARRVGHLAAGNLTCPAINAAPPCYYVLSPANLSRQVPADPVA